MAKRPHHDAWADARLRWEANTNATFESVGKLLGVSRAAVSKRAGKEAWSRPESLHQINERAQLRADARQAKRQGRKVANAVPSTSKVDDATRKEAVADVAADVRADVLERHRADWAAHRGLFDLALIAKDFEMGKKAKISAEMLLLRQKGEAAAHGLNDGQSSGNGAYERLRSEVLDSDGNVRG